MANLHENPMPIGNTIDSYREEIITSLREIIRFPSVREPALPGKPYGAPAYEALQYALALGESWGFKTRNVDGYAGYVEFGEDETGADSETVAVLAHLDVVPAGQGWTVPPYEGVLEGDRIFGRGASDDKGPAIVALYGLKALQDAGFRPRRKIRVILGCSEETGSEDMAYYFSKEPLPLMAFTPDVGYPAINREKGILHLRMTKGNPDQKAEPGFLCRIQGGDAINMVPRQCTATIDATRLNEAQIRCLEQTIGTEGRVSAVRRGDDPNRIILETIGKSSHGAVPELGVNAILLMTKWLGTLREDGNEADFDFLQFLNEALGAGTNGEGLGIDCADSESGALSMNVGSLHMDAGSWTVALDIRYPVSVNGERIAAAIREKAREVGAELIADRHTAPLHFPEDHPLIERLSIAYELHTGKKLELLSTGGGTYARSMGGRGIGFGGAGADAHSPDEYVEVSDLMQHARICTQAIYEISR